MATSDTPLRERLSEMLDQWTLTQKVTMVAVVALTLTGLLYIAYSASAPSYRTLFRNLSPETSAKIVETLEQKQIPFKLEGPSNIQVPEDQVHHTRLMLAGLDLPGLEGDGFELFDKNEFGMTAFTQKVNYKRAMEAELGRTIRHLEPVERVRVHLVLPEKALFKDDQNPPSASIVVGLVPGSKLKPSQIKSIQYLASASVEGLDATNVAIVDQYGATLAKPRASDTATGGVDPGDQAEAVERMESDYEKRVVAMLAPLVGRENVRATVRVEVDTTRVTETAELYDPDKTAVRREQRTEESNNQPDPANKGVVGANAQLRGAAAPAATATTGGKSRVNEVLDYEVNKTIRQTVRSGVRVQRLSVAVLFNDAVRLKAAEGAKKDSEAKADDAKEGDAKDAEAKEGEEKADGAKADAAKAEAMAAAAAALDMKQVEALVKSAVGFDPQRGDSIEIVREDFHTGPEVKPSDPLPFWQEPAFLTAAMRYAVMIFVALLLALFVLRPIARALQPPKSTKAELAAQAAREPKQVVGRTVAEIENEMVSAELVDDEFGEDGMLPVDPVQEAQKRLRAEVIDLGTSDIDRTSQVISEWIRMG